MKAEENNPMTDEFNEIEERLAGLRNVEQRGSAQAEKGRAAYLELARQLKTENLMSETKNSQAPVSEPYRGRLIGWLSAFNHSIQDIFGMKEQPAMFTPIITAVMVFILVFGGVGATAYAAQDSLPSDALYPVKTLTEDVQFGLSAQEQDRLDFALSLAERRVSEMSALAGLNIPVPANVATRMGEKVEAALRIAAGLDGQGVQEGLGMILTRMRVQEQILAGLEANQPGDPVLVQARLRLREQLQLAAQGMNDPSELMRQLQQREQTRPWVVLGNSNGNVNGGNDNSANGNSNGNNTNGNDDNGNGANGNDNNGNDANSNGNNDNDDNGNDANGNGSNGNDDNGNDANGNDNNGNDDNGNDANGNGNNGNDDGDNDSGSGSGGNGNGNDDSGSGSGGNGNGNDDSGSGGGGNGNGNDDDGSGSGGGNGNDDDGSGSGDGGNDNGNDDGGSGGGGNGNDGGGSGGGGNDGGGLRLISLLIQLGISIN